MISSLCQAWTFTWKLPLWGKTINKPNKDPKIRVWTEYYFDRNLEFQSAKVIFWKLVFSLIGSILFYHSFSLHNCFVFSLQQKLSLWFSWTWAFGSGSQGLRPKKTKHWKKLCYLFFTFSLDSAEGNSVNI